MPAFTLLESLSAPSPPLSRLMASNFTFVIGLKTAKELGIVAPPELAAARPTATKYHLSDRERLDCRGDAKHRPVQSGPSATWVSQRQKLMADGS